MIAILLPLARIVLCVVFVASALAKFRHQQATRQAVIDFGVPKYFSRPIAAMLPAIELLFAIGLLPLATARAAAAGMTIILAIFTLVITVSIVRGKRTVCHCFGETGTEPVGWWSVGRNLGLGALAILIAWPKASGAGESVTLLLGWKSQGNLVAPMISLVALVICGGLTWALINLFRRYGLLLLRIEELEKGKPVAPAATLEGLLVGAPIPQFAFPSIDGRRVSKDDLRQAGKPTLLIFSDPNCGMCSTMLPEIERWAVDHAGQFVVALVTRGDLEVNRKKFSKVRVPQVLVESDESLSRALSALATPSALVMRPNGRVGSKPAIGADAIRRLVEQLSVSSKNEATSAAPVPESGLGSAVPSFELPALTGGNMKETDLQGETVLLFWDPGCGFCAAMLDSLRRWDATRSDHSPNLLVISTGADETNRALLLSSPVILDKSFQLARSMGVSGTPSAILIDERGHVASEVAVGEPGIWRLIGVGAY